MLLLLSQIAAIAAVVAGVLMPPNPGWFVLGLGGTGLLASWLLLGLARRRERRSHRKYQLLGEVAVEVNRAVLLNENEDRIFSTILDYAFLILDSVKHGSVLTYDETGQLFIAASRGFQPAYIQSFRVRLEDTWQYRQTGGIIDDAMIVRPETIHASGHKHDAWTWEYQSVMSAPLYVGGKLYGLLNLDSYRQKTFDEDDLKVMRWFRGQIEVCLLARDRYRTALADSRIDGLTKFLSRATFDERFHQSLDHAERYDEVFTLGMFDVDGLKQINDLIGHVAGDLVIKTVADALRETARKSDLLGRYGGDEFVAVFHSTNATAMAERFTELLKALREKAPAFQGTTLPTSFSFGFADYPAEGKTFEQLVALADERLYRRKNARRPG